ncbi:uncharacterized protein STEHIDRAFT_145994 [Stereum hirsutum FP-91666 SS1]|uniref:uncharacterized protein n=1 Tax=Stereum hirsutum (strain FP-91666) TaxID=721885 RepID=UPI000440AB9F|nr:uncharacterized protein STEHIDRAFT_145994 [Stereum hirsutum FP-91666 SS1]EIM87746.1 hypothetical protein STEHIDRAFT_145994 [Stereum hirsutum FP-91666 SS1]
MFRLLSRPPVDDEHEPLVSQSRSQSADDLDIEQEKPDHEQVQELSPVLSDTGTAVNDEHHEHAPPNRSRPSATSPTNHSTRFWAFVCVVCAAINLVLAVLFPTVHLHSPSWSKGVAETERYGLQPMRPFNMKDLSSLKRPSHFIGFEQIDRQAIASLSSSGAVQAEKKHQFDNYPIVVAQVDSARGREDESMGVFTRRRMVRVGVVEGTEKWVFVNKTVSTIFQFRAFDYGMEQCDLRISIPALPLSSSSYSSSSSSNPDSFPLSIYRLDAPSELDPYALTQRTRPSRIAKLADLQPGVWLPESYGESHGGGGEEDEGGAGNATLHISDISNHGDSSSSSNTTNGTPTLHTSSPPPGHDHNSPRRTRHTTYHRSFHCAREELYTFELACSDVEVQRGGEGCAVEWWQDEEGVEAVGGMSGAEWGRGGGGEGPMVWVVQRESE